jgi:hypothetical protein
VFCGPPRGDQAQNSRARGGVDQSFTICCTGRQGFKEQVER